MEVVAKALDKGSEFRQLAYLYVFADFSESGLERRVERTWELEGKWGEPLRLSFGVRLARGG